MDSFDQKEEMEKQFLSTQTNTNTFILMSSKVYNFCWHVKKQTLSESGEDEPHQISYFQVHINYHGSQISIKWMYNFGRHVEKVTIGLFQRSCMFLVLPDIRIKCLKELISN